MGVEESLGILAGACGDDDVSALQSLRDVIQAVNLVRRRRGGGAGVGRFRLVPAPRDDKASERGKKQSLHEFLRKKKRPPDRASSPLDSKLAANRISSDFLR